MNPPPRYYPSPVDYEAWGKGYTPPSEHVLIDQLAYRGARIVLSADSGPDGPAYWLVVRGKTSPHKVCLAIAKLLAEWEENEELAALSPAENGAVVSTEGSAGQLRDDQHPHTKKEGE